MSSSSQVHSIRLRGPWDVTFFPVDQATTAVVDQQTIDLPVEWRDLFGNVAGRAMFERRFNRPTGLTDGHRVRVLFQNVFGTLHVRLNDQPLAVQQPSDAVHSVEITGRMQPHNLLKVEINFDPGDDPQRPGGLWQPVILQIEEPDEASP